MPKGTVKFFNGNKGFGFITQEEGDDLFFHVTNIDGNHPEEGSKVEYEIGEGRKGPQAEHVRVVE